MTLFWPRETLCEWGASSMGTCWLSATLWKCVAQLRGDLVSFAKRETVVSGTVEGNIYSLSNSLDLDGQLGHSLYGLMQSLDLNDRGHVGEGMVVAAGDISLEGEVGRSATIYAGNTDVSGSIGRELTMAGDNLTLTNTARVGGNLSARVRQLKNVHIADGATITELTRRPSAHEREPFRPAQVLLLPSGLARCRHVGGMVGPDSVSRLLPGQRADGGFRLAQPWAWAWSAGRHARGYGLDSHHAGWLSCLADVARVLSNRDLPG